jgi:cytochrome d ubiquinol oxidase subunit I
MEAHWQTNPPGQGAPWKLLAWPNPGKQGNDWTFLTIPDGLSLLITRTFTGQVKGLRDFPPEDQPPIALPFYTFRIMLGVGFGLVGLLLLTLWYWRRGWLTPENIGGNKWLLSTWVAAIPAGIVAIEAGWVTREVGRQPWVIYGLLRTSAGASPLPAAAVGTSLFVYGVIYLILFAALMVFAGRILKRGPDLTRPAPQPGQAEPVTGAWPWN